MAKKKNIEENVSKEIPDVEVDVDEEDIDEDNYDDEDFGDVVVEMQDEEGNSYYYVEQMIIPVGDQDFALLVEIPDHDHECCGGHHHDHEGCECGCEDGDVIIAKIVQDENGEDIYVEPTDEEFDAVQKAYDEMVFDDFDEDEDLK
ncbi:MAG: DUF1292 domain-containing protein [Selenomonadaceae bacterium]|nr:DUF1292 domain-containing protein [Selenomonadaceae bacterium]